MCWVMIICPPFVKVIGDVVTSWIWCGVLKVDDDVLCRNQRQPLIRGRPEKQTHPMMFRHTYRRMLIQLENVAILRIVV